MRIRSRSWQGESFTLQLDPDRVGERAYVLDVVDAWMRAAGWSVTVSPARRVTSDGSGQR